MRDPTSWGRVKDKSVHGDYASVKELKEYIDYRLGEPIYLPRNVEFA
jgi:hypothetical protein